MVKSKTKIEKQTRKKTNLILVETIRTAKKHKAWKPVAEVLSGPRKHWANKNLNKVNEEASGSDAVVIVGKVLSMGDVESNLKVVALSFSEKAKEKIIKAGGKTINMLDEIKSNPEMKGLKIIKK